MPTEQNPTGSYPCPVTGRLCVNPHACDTAGCLRALPSTTPPVAQQTTDRQGEVTEALRRYDAAWRAHLRDCWLGCDNEANADARYRAAIDAKDALDRAIARYASRHAREFEMLAAAPEPPHAD